MIFLDEVSRLRTLEHLRQDRSVTQTRPTDDAYDHCRSFNNPIHSQWSITHKPNVFYSMLARPFLRELSEQRILTAETSFFVLLFSAVVA